MQSNGLYIGIDPATKTSPLGIVCLDSHLRMIDSLLLDPEVPPKEYVTPGSRWDPLLTYRIEIIRSELALFFATHCNVKAVFIEEPRLLGKANKNMLKLLGVIENLIWFQYLKSASIHYIDPSTSKKWAGGHGASDKDQVLSGVLKFTKCDRPDFIRLGKLCYDLSDATAAIVAGLKSGAYVREDI